MLDYPKVDLVTRLIAAVIDGVISSLVGFIPIIGGIIGAVYMLIKDGLFEGQSVGKKVMKIQVRTESNEKADFMISVRRNAIFAVPYLIMVVPIIGWIVAPIVGLVILVIELMKLNSDPNGRRLGDTWAPSQVVFEAETSQLSEEG